MDIKIGDFVAKRIDSKDKQEWIVGVIIDIHSMERGIAGERPRVYYTVEWSYDCEQTVELGYVTHVMRSDYLKLLTSGE